MKIQNSSGKNVPQRTCIGCREVKPKHQLVRIVSTPDGKTEIDPSGKKSGRGAYVCRSLVCWEKGLSKGRLDRALRKNISLDEQTKLAELNIML